MTTAARNGSAVHEVLRCADLGDAAQEGTAEAGLAPTDRRSPAGSNASGPVAALEAQVIEARGIVALQDDQALQDALSPSERAADRKVTEKIRGKERDERKRAGIEQTRSARLLRSDDRWSSRARRSRDRLLNPNRRLAATYRRYRGLSVVPPVLIAAGVAWMSATVHDGLVGVDGPWLAYLVEPMASILLVVSMIAGFTAIQNGEDAPRLLVRIDVALAAASLLLNVVPWSLRYGWDIGMLIAHALPPLLIIAAVVVHHTLSTVFSTILTSLYDELSPTRLSEQTSDIVLFYERARREVEAGRITVGESGLPSRESIRRAFGIGKIRAQLTGDAFEHIQKSL